MPDEDIRETLANIHSLEELEALVGEITPEEREMLDRLDPDKYPITEEELAATPPDFTARVTEKVLERIRAERRGE